jgi:hypothetical protein
MAFKTIKLFLFGLDPIKKSIQTIELFTAACAPSDEFLHLSYLLYK